MTRLTLIAWSSSEARERARQLRDAGHRVRVLVPGRRQDPRGGTEPPPEAFVIDLSRRPSEGRDIGLFLRRRKASRSVPLVFVGGEPEKTKRTREVLPDAVFCRWPGVRGAIRRAVSRPPEGPVVPGRMAGYSGTPLPRKLGIREGTAVALLGAPAGFAKTLGPLPEGARLRTTARGPARLVLLFARSKADLGRRFPAAVRAMEEGGSVWIAWPKKASGVATDLTGADVRAHGLAGGLVDFKICAIDATWSGLRFARRRS